MSVSVMQGLGAMLILAGMVLAVVGETRGADPAVQETRFRLASRATLTAGRKDYTHVSSRGVPSGRRLVTIPLRMLLFENSEALELLAREVLPVGLTGPGP
jgi:hypothetical protein